MCNMYKCNSLYFMYIQFFKSYNRCMCNKHKLSNWNICKYYNSTLLKLSTTLSSMYIKSNNMYHMYFWLLILQQYMHNKLSSRYVSIFNILF